MANLQTDLPQSPVVVKRVMACGMNRCFLYTNNYMVNNNMVRDLPCEEVPVLPRRVLSSAPVVVKINTY